MSRLLGELGVDGPYALVERNGEPVERERYGESRSRRETRSLSHDRLPAAEPRLYLITARRVPTWPSSSKRQSRGGVDIVQIREKELTDCELLPHSPRGAPA